MTRLLNIDKAAKYGRAWLPIQEGTFEVGKVYVRISKRILFGKVRTCLDLASIEIDEDFQQCGIGTEVVGLLIQANESYFLRDYIYAESVINNYLAKILVCKGFVFLATALPDRCYVLQHVARKTK